MIQMIKMIQLTKHLFIICIIIMTINGTSIDLKKLLFTIFLNRILTIVFEGHNIMNGKRLPTIVLLLENNYLNCILDIQTIYCEIRYLHLMFSRFTLPVFWIMYCVNVWSNSRGTDGFNPYTTMKTHDNVFIMCIFLILFWFWFVCFRL